MIGIFIFAAFLQAVAHGCRPLYTPFFGWKSCSPNDKDIGSVCTFECNDTHYLRGSKERQCTQNHEWSGAPTECILKPECILPLHYLFEDKIQAECSAHRIVKLTEVCSFSCNEIFQLIGPNQLTCQLNGLLTDEKRGRQTYPSCHSVRNPCKNSSCPQLCRFVSGRAQCFCAEGFALTENGRTCSDIDECSIKNGGCDGVCHNTVGNFTCSCDEGYVPSEVDRYSCVDVDECKENNGGCVDICENFQGGYQCLCSEGYHVHPDGKSCIVLQCPPLLPPEHGDVYPPSCKDGTIQVKEKCIFTCLQGFRIAGQEVFTCNNNLKWDVKNDTQCLPETDAFIVCPEDITVELMPNETSAEIFLVAPKSNIEPILVRPDWISLDRVNFFPAKETKVMFYVEDSYNKAECNISVFVIDKEPPFPRLPRDPLRDRIRLAGAPSWTGRNRLQSTMWELPPL
ncbi:hypothetical protein CEXT_361291 [Caerostris extrusa]|uniref:Sushi domain-containing protein n=1 Tax=Caerostris extrusa TaxID=172846 RepID=A0AAV4XSK4_CAEEX|nr:hypothetical protein CEXT_361291 [Caerostris extrusa]